MIPNSTKQIFHEWQGEYIQMQRPHKNGSASKLRFRVVRLKTYHCNPVERGLG